MALVRDANTTVAACFAADGFAVFATAELLAPDLMWWEAVSTLHEYLWRIDAERRTSGIAALTWQEVLDTLQRLYTAPVRPVPVTDSLVEEAWQVATRCGFARLYDAAYVTVARVAGATLVTLDARLRHSPAARLVTILGPTELEIDRSNAEGP